MSKAAAQWLGFLGVVAAGAAIVLVPVVLDPGALAANPNEAYYPLKLKVLLMTSAALLVAVLGVLLLGGRPVVVPVLVPVLTLLGVTSLSTLFSERSFHSLYGDRGEGLLSLAAGVLLFYALARGPASEKQVRLFLAAAVTAAALVSLYGIAQNYGLNLILGWDDPPFRDLGRAPATVGNPITLAAYLTLMMGAATALWLRAGSRAGRVAWLLALALIGACWIYTDTRGALLGAGVALPVVLLAARHRMGTVRPLMVPIAVLLVTMAVAVVASRALGFSTLPVSAWVILLSYLAVVGVLLWLLFRGKTWATLLLLLVMLAVAAVLAVAAPRYLPLADLGLADGPSSFRGGDLSLQTRLYIWRDTVPMILDRPLLGHGPDNFASSFQPYRSEELNALTSNNRGQMLGVDRAHSDLLQVAATTGLLGLAAYLWVLVSYFRNAYRRGGWTLAALSGGVLAYVLQIQTAFPNIVTSVAFWSILGASVALMRLLDLGGGDATGDVGAAPLPDAPEKRGRGELLVAVVVVGILSAIAVPTFLEQRANAARAVRAEVTANVQQAVKFYERAERSSGTYPEAGVYTERRPIRSPEGSPKLRPSDGVTLTTKITPTNDFTVEGRSTTLSGTFRYSYDSATGEYTALPDPAR